MYIVLEETMPAEVLDVSHSFLIFSSLPFICVLVLDNYAVLYTLHVM